MNEQWIPAVAALLGAAIPTLATIIITLIGPTIDKNREIKKYNERFILTHFKQFRK